MGSAFVRRFALALRRSCSVELQVAYHEAQRGCGWFNDRAVRLGVSFDDDAMVDREVHHAFEWHHCALGEVGIDMDFACVGQVF